MLYACAIHTIVLQALNFFFRLAMTPNENQDFASHYTKERSVLQGGKKGQNYKRINQPTINSRNNSGLLFRCILNPLQKTRIQLKLYSQRLDRWQWQCCISAIKETSDRRHCH